MSRRGTVITTACAVVAWLGATAAAAPTVADPAAHAAPVRAHVVAVGIPDASAVSAVGTFLPGGPIHDNPLFAAYTQPGRILDPARILVASRSNFGTPAADPGSAEGALLSIDPSGEGALVVPPLFAASGGQASTLDGRVQMFSSHSLAFRNGNNNPNAVTAGFTGVSNPVGLSINNAFGRLWPANVPDGLRGTGTSTILDPTGVPMAGAPNAAAGGVFAGALTPRQPSQVVPGALDHGAIGTAFLGRSPDGSRRAVFCVVLADGGIVQVHTEQGVDGLAPERTVRPVLGPDSPDRHGVAPRVGVLVNFKPTRTLYVSEPSNDTVAAIDLHDDGVVFRPGPVRRIHSRAFDEPVDLAPVSIETAHPNWASNTTLREGSDIYVVNRGNNTIVRLRQDGTVVAVRRVLIPSGGWFHEGRLNGIAVSSDGSTIWITATGETGHGRHRARAGAVLKLAAFG
jgi:hypothetical protein